MLKQQEEGDGRLLGRIAQCAGPAREQARHADHSQDNGDGDGGDADPDPQVAVGLRGERAHPESRDEEVVRENGNGQDVHELPAQKARVEVVRALDQVVVDFRLDADGDAADYNQPHHHGALDVVGYEADFEPAEGGVDGRDGAFNDDGGEAVEAREGGDDLLERREFRNHVQEQGDQPAFRLGQPSRTVFLMRADISQER